MPEPSFAVFSSQFFHPKQRSLDNNVCVCTEGSDLQTSKTTLTTFIQYCIRLPDTGDVKLGCLVLSWTSLELCSLQPTQWRWWGAASCRLRRRTTAANIFQPSIVMWDYGYDWTTATRNLGRLFNVLWFISWLIYKHLLFYIPYKVTTRQEKGMNKHCAII